MHERGIETQKDIATVVPALESLVGEGGKDAPWLSEISKNGQFAEQVEERKKLNDRLDTVISQIPRPDISLEKAIAEGMITEKEVTELYDSLKVMLDDPEYRRLALYLPFEFLPTADQKMESNELRESAERFKESYMTAWKSLLVMYDVRANFVDGDILEDGHREGDHPRVVKAAHLIPELVQKGLLSKEEVFSMLQETEDKILRHSIADTIPVLADLGLVTVEELDALGVADVYSREKLELAFSEDELSEEVEEVHEVDVSVSSVQDQLRRHMMLIDTAEYGNLTKRREGWIKQVQAKNAIDLSGNDIERAILDGKLSSAELEQYTAQETGSLVQRALVVGIRQAIESVPPEDADRAKSLYTKYRKSLLLLWNQASSPDLREELLKTFCHLRALKILTDDQLHTLGITMPAIAGPFSENLKTMNEESSEMKRIVSEIEKNTELFKYIYPVALFYGSRLKGYGSEHSDLDVAVLIKPETPFEEREKIIGMLQEVFQHRFIEEDQIKEFWLEKNEEVLRVRKELEGREETIGGPSWTHILFGAAWEGKDSEVERLRKELLVPYFQETDETIYDRPFRAVCLEEIERDALQYRLMHKGYERFYPDFGGIKTPHADEIDGKSKFWDSGYRQTATKLFTSRVFLPKLAKS